MPTRTFKNLPLEKQEHIVSVSRCEFKKHTFMDSSVNRIIQNASIARGSFYQYFLSKEDLYFYVVGQDIKRVVSRIYLSINKEDDFFTSLIKVYDTLYKYAVENNETEYYKNLLSSIQKMDVQLLGDRGIFNAKIKQTVKNKIEYLNKSNIDDLLDLLFFYIGSTAIKSLEKVEEQEINREKFINLLVLIHDGIEG